MNHKSVSSLIVFIVIVIVIIFAVRSCQQTKEIELRQKSTDKKTEISLEIEKERRKNNK